MTKITGVEFKAGYRKNKAFCETLIHRENENEDQWNMLRSAIKEQIAPAATLSELLIKSATLFHSIVIGDYWKEELKITKGK